MTDHYVLDRVASWVRPRPAIRDEAIFLARHICSIEVVGAMTAEELDQAVRAACACIQVQELEAHR